MIVTRFAPSPTGLLHLGHAFSVLSAEKLALEARGQLVLRIEDIDNTRCKPAFQHAILRDLNTLTINFEEPVVVQSRNLAAYEAALMSLHAKGLLYRCFRTRRDVALASASAAHDEHPATHPGPHASSEEAEFLSQGRPFAWRLSAERACAHLNTPTMTVITMNGTTTEGVFSIAALDDIILARKDFPASYHLASVLDDAAQGVTDIVRGADLVSAAPYHRVLQALLGLPAVRYHHHPLIADVSGRRLAKRDSALTLHSLFQSGVTSALIRSAFQQGPEAFSRFAAECSARWAC